jgi:c(7)-type cytochrome triheme protein
MKRTIGLAVVVGAFLSAVVWMFVSPPVEGFYGDMVLNSKAEQRGMPPVVFPHWIHRAEFKCKVCHPAIFEMKSGANDIDMEKIVFKGQFCGKCHNGEIAWKPVICARCHSGKPGMVTGPLHGVN